MLTVLLVDNDPTAGDFTCSLEQAGYAVIGASQLAQAKSQLEHVRLDVVLLDWELGDGPAVGFVRHLRREPRTGNLPIVILGVRRTENDVITALECGGDDFVTRPFSTRELIARMKSVQRARTVDACGGQVEIGNVTLDPSRVCASVSGRTLALGTLEFRLFHFFISHPERVVSRGMLLQQVWGRNDAVALRTVDVYIRRLRMALGVHSALIDTVRGEGYRFRPAVGESGISAP